MRLIDADELMSKVKTVKYLRKLKAQFLCDECREYKAIPIEWMLNYLDEDHRYFYQLDPHSFVKAMIEDWRNVGETE